MQVELFKLLGIARLSGKSLGRKHFPKLCAALVECAADEIVVLDFRSIEDVTGSWINAALVPLFRWMATEPTNLFPVLAAVQGDWLDEFRTISDFTGVCFFVADPNVSFASHLRLIGTLDETQRATLSAVVQGGELTGAALERQLPDDGVGATAWNNRLKDLYDKRLLRRRKLGREQRYSSITREVVYDVG